MRLYWQLTQDSCIYTILCKFYLLSKNFMEFFMIMPVEGAIAKGCGSEPCLCSTKRMSNTVWITRSCEINHWGLKVGVALHFSNPSSQETSMKENIFTQNIIVCIVIILLLRASINRRQKYPALASNTRISIFLSLANF